MPQVATDDGHVFELSEITHTSQIGDKGSMITVKLKSGMSHRIPLSAYEFAVEHWFQAVTPALPGTYILDPLTGDNGKFDGWIKSVVVSWGVTHAGAVWPLTREGVQFEYRHVMHPNGEIETSRSMGIYNIRELTKLEYPDFELTSDQFWAAN